MPTRRVCFDLSCRIAAIGTRAVRMARAAATGTANIGGAAMPAKANIETETGSRLRSGTINGMSADVTVIEIKFAIAGMRVIEIATATVVTVMTVAATTAITMTAAMATVTGMATITATIIGITTGAGTGTVTGTGTATVLASIWAALGPGTPTVTATVATMGVATVAATGIASTEMIAVWSIAGAITVGAVATRSPCRSATTPGAAAMCRLIRTVGSFESAVRSAEPVLRFLWSNRRDLQLLARSTVPGAVEYRQIWSRVEGGARLPTSNLGDGTGNDQLASW